MLNTITEVLPINLTLQEPYTIEVEVISVESKKACDTIKDLSEKYPFSKYKLSHLKRAKKSQCRDHIFVIVAPKEEIEELSDLLPMAFNCQLCGISKSWKVPKIPPYTKHQLSTWSRYWPSILESPDVVPYIHTEAETLQIAEVFQSIEPNTALLYVPTTGYISNGHTKDGPLDHAEMVAINNFECRENSYLCTDAYAFTFNEPCIMCAMAFVHSRVQRLYFLHPSEKGAFSHWKLNERSVNYMYRIFQFINN